MLSAIEYEHSTSTGNGSVQQINCCGPWQSHQLAESYQGK